MVSIAIFHIPLILDAQCKDGDGPQKQEDLFGMRLENHPALNSFFTAKIVRTHINMLKI